MSFITRKKTVHLRAVRPRRKHRVKRGPDERGAQVQALCGEFVSTADAVRPDRMPARTAPNTTSADLCPACEKAAGWDR